MKSSKLTDLEVKVYSICLSSLMEEELAFVVSIHVWSVLPSEWAIFQSERKLTWIVFFYFRVSGLNC